MITEFNGKKFNKTETKFVNEKIGYEDRHATLTITVSNRFTGVSHNLPVLAQDIFDWINRWSDSYERSMIPPRGSSVKEFDMARSLFRKLWPSEYMDLLD